MFPTLRISLNGVSLGANYMVLMDIVPVDDKRYRYAYHRSTWLVAGKADPPAPVRLYMHPDSPFTGEQLLKQIISFEKVKLTNNTTDQNGHVSKRGLYLYSEIFIMNTARRLEWKQLHEIKFPFFWLSSYINDFVQTQVEQSRRNRLAGLLSPPASTADNGRRSKSG